MIFLLAACTPAAAPSAAIPTAGTQYVIGGQAGPGVQWLVTAPCSSPPHGWHDAVNYCDLTALTAVPVTEAVYAAKNQGDPYP